MNNRGDQERLWFCSATQDGRYTACIVCAAYETFAENYARDEMSHLSLETPVKIMLVPLMKRRDSIHLIGVDVKDVPDVKRLWFCTVETPGHYDAYLCRAKDKYEAIAKARDARQHASLLDDIEAIEVPDLSHGIAHHVAELLTLKE